MTKSFSDMREKKTPCWSGYKMVGMKKKNGRMVPNCVKEELVDLVLGKEYVSEGVEDMYKGKLNQAQINTIKNTWQHKKTLLPQDKERVKKFIDQMDQFTKMQLKKANIKHVSAMIEENELDFSEPLCDMLEDVEFKAAVRGQELKEFSDDQLNKLAIAYKDLAGKTMSVQNANKLRKLFDRIPDSSLDKIRRKKIPFISGLALSRMVQKGMPVRESAFDDEVAVMLSGVENDGRQDLEEDYVVKYQHYNRSGPMNAAAYENKKDAEKFRDTVLKQGGKATLLTRAQFGGQTLKNSVSEADLTKSQTKKVHKMADKLPKKDFIQRYGKDGDSVRYATATNMIKKKMGIGESKFKLNKGELQMSESYKQRFDSAMGHLGISSLGELNPEDQKPFFTFVDDLKEGLTAAQKKLPPALQKAIAKKMKDKKEVKEDLVGGQKKLDKDKDGDLDAKDFAMLRKGAKKEMMMKDKMKKEDAMGQEPMKKIKAPMPKEADTTTMKDAPKAKEGMKAVVKTKQVTENRRYLKTKPGSLEEAVLKTRGLVK